MISQFRKMLSEIATSGLIVAPVGGTEPNANLSTISLSRAQVDSVTPADVISFLHQAADTYDLHRRESQVTDQGGLFYTWVDEMAGQLRFSVVSNLPLPFGCQIRIIADPSVIAHQLLACPHLDGIPFSSLTAGYDSSSVQAHILDVCVIRLPRCKDQ